MESLPLEVVEMVVRRISGQDLAACCAASHSWRDIFNRDLFWKHLCKPETAVYLSRTSCRVEPAFVSPEVEGSGLEPVSQWWMNFMRENHLLNNWRSGRCLIHEIPDFEVDHLEKIVFYQEEFFITVGEDGIEIVIWDLRFDPVIYVNEPCRLLSSGEVNDLFLCGNSLIVVQRLAVLVFQINLMQKTWPLQHIFFLLENESTDFKSASDAIQDTSLWSVCSCYTSLVGNYLLASFIGSRRYLHIWDVVNGLKMKEETLDSGDCSICKIKPSTTSLDDIIVYRDTPGKYEKVMVYSLINLTCYPCVFQGAEYSDLHKDKIVVKMKMPFDYLLIANYKTGEHLYRIEGLNWSRFSTYEMFGNKLIFKTTGGINQINLSTGEIKQYLDARATIKDYQLLGDKFICMEFCEEDDEIDFFNDRPKDIWEIRGSKRLVEVSIALLNSNNVVTNTTLTKMIVEYVFKTNVISFW